MSRFRDPKIWRRLTYFWTVVLFAFVIIDFITNNAYADILLPVAAIYTAVLGIYSADKEFRRWHHKRPNKTHPGEIFVIIWTVLVFGLLILDFIFAKSYELPSQISATYIVVLGILVITKRSKSLFREHQNACRVCDETRFGH